MAVWRCLGQRLKSLEEENARLKKLPKPCWIRRRFRWLWGESTDDRPEAGSRVDV
jgi:putative transposase